MGRNLEERLIKLVRQFPALYDTYDYNYVKNKYKQEIWVKIAKELNLADGEDAKSIWVKLRHNHRDSLRRHKRMIKNGATGNIIKSWKYKSQMEFLIQYMYRENREATNNDEFPILPQEQIKQEPKEVEEPLVDDNGELRQISNHEFLKISNEEPRQISNEEFRQISNVNSRQISNEVFRQISSENSCRISKDNTRQILNEEFGQSLNEDPRQISNEDSRQILNEDSRQISNEASRQIFDSQGDNSYDSFVADSPPPVKKMKNLEHNLHQKCEQLPKDGLYLFFMSMYELTKKMPEASQHNVRKNVFLSISEEEGRLLGKFP